MTTARLPSRQKLRLTDHSGPVHALRYSSGTEQYLLTASADRSIKFYNTSRDASSALVKSFENAHGHAVLALTVSVDNSRFASGGGARTAEIFVWDSASGKPTRRLGDHSGRVECVEFCGDSDAILVSGGFDAAVRIWDLRTQNIQASMILRDAKDSVNSVAIGAATIFAGSVDGRVRHYDLRMGKTSIDVVGSAVGSISLTKEADSILVSSLDSTIKLLDTTSGSMLQQFKDPDFRSVEYRVRSTLAANDALVVSGSEDGYVYVWNVLSGERSQRIKHIQGMEQGTSSKSVISAVTSRKNGDEWASAGADCAVCVWGL